MLKIFGLIPVNEFPCMEINEKSIRETLDSYSLPHDHIHIYEDKNTKAPLWVNNNFGKWNKIGYNPLFISMKSMILHEYGHTKFNKKICDSLNLSVGVVSKYKNAWLTFASNAEYHADKFTLETLYRYGHIDELKVHLMSMLFYEHSRKVCSKIPAEHEIAASRIFKEKWFKKYKKHIDEYSILQRKYYVPSTTV